MKHILFALLLPLCLHGQAQLTWYLPDVPYNPAIPTPESYLGYQVGQWHASHDQLVGYMRMLDAASDRIQLNEYGRSHENRPLFCLTITTPANQARLDIIRKNRKMMTDPAQSGSINPADQPAVVYMGYSIHGNEASGSNAALLVAYYLAAAQSPELDKQLENTVILFDPCFNPDGMQRFSAWVNSHRARHGSADPVGDEFNEPWPNGRTNHYGFDLNRDWLVATQPETPGRIAIYQAWHPNVLTDHHEMSPNATFFFQPGVPSRVNSITPARNQELTAAIGRFHAEALSAKNIAFFSKENYDDFFYGKGSTYPDVNGGIGILFEQASSRGSAQQTENGLLTFPYTIRNQVLTSLSTLKAVQVLRPELNTYLSTFYASVIAEALQDSVKAYVLAEDGANSQALLRILQLHQIEVYQLNEDLPAAALSTRLEPSDAVFRSGKAFLVPTGQAQYRLIRAIFERPLTFPDSIFYDISAWTLPDAMGLAWAGVPERRFSEKILGQKIDAWPEPSPVEFTPRARYAYVAEAHQHNLPALLVAGFRLGWKMKVATKTSVFEGKIFKPGSVVFAVPERDSNFHEALLQESGALGVPLTALSNGQSDSGPDAGSSSFRPLQQPNVVLATGKGMPPNDVGEIWHLMDQVAGLPVALVDGQRLSARTLDRFNVLVLAGGTPEGLSTDDLRAFAAKGNTIIALGDAVGALANWGLGDISVRYESTGVTGKRRPYTAQPEDEQARRGPGAIFEAELDLSHPVCFGYQRDHLPVFMLGNEFIDPPDNPYAMPVALANDPLLAGYVHAEVLPYAAGSAGVQVTGIGQGRIIAMPINPCFRGYWKGTERLLINAVFFGNIIKPETTRRN